MSKKKEQELNKSFGFPVYDNYATGSISGECNDLYRSNENDLSIIYTSIKLSSNIPGAGILSGGENL